MAELSPIIAARFWSKVDVKKSRHDCWLWQGCSGSKGYGNLKIKGRSVSAHRVSYALCNGGFPPDGMVTRHKCDNPQCVNPFHLEIGTVADNSRDMVERGRAHRHKQNGDRNFAAKLTGEDVADIRKRILAGETNVSIAKDYDVGHSMISKIRCGVHWGENE